MPRPSGDPYVIVRVIRAVVPQRLPRIRRQHEEFIVHIGNIAMAVSWWPRGYRAPDLPTHPAATD